MQSVPGYGLEVILRSLRDGTARGHLPLESATWKANNCGDMEQ